MSDFFKINLTMLREQKGENQLETATLLGLSRSTYANYETGANLPKADTMMKIIGHFGVSFEEIMQKDLSKGANSKKLSQQKDNQKGANHGVKPGAKGQNTEAKGYLPLGILPPGDKEISPFSKVVPEDLYTVDAQNNVYDLTSKAAAGTIVHMVQESDKFRVKPNLYLPGLGSGIHIRVPIGGDSMHNTIKDGDKPVATLISELSSIRPGHIYLLLDKDDGLVCKRVYWDGGDTFELISDNEIYAPYNRHLSDILAIFRVQEVHTRDLRPYFNDLRKEMREIRAEMAYIRRHLPK